MTEYLGWIVTAVAVTGVVLNNRRRRACFLVWVVSNALSAAIHATAGMWALTARDLIFLVLSIHGFRCWGGGGPPASNTETKG